MVPRLDTSRSIISLSRMTHQMWRNHPLGQRNKTAIRAERVEVGRGGQNMKKGAGNIGENTNLI